MDQVCTVPLSSACASSSLPLPARRLDPYLGPWSKIDRRFRHRAIKRPFLSGCAPDLKLLRRGLLKGIGVSGISMCVSVLSEASVEGVERLPFKPEGYNFWTWRGHKIHYVVEGEGRPIVLIHGFGASAFHWSLGGFTALITAADCQEFVSGVALLNSAGQFGNPEEQAKNDVKETAIQRLIFNPLKQLVQRAVLSFAFWQAKQPSRIQSVLKSVYPNPTNVDDYLVESIIKPADDPNAGEVYYRLMTQFMFSPSKVTLDGLLEKLSCPLLLLWGDLDPWVGPSKANKIKELYPNSSLVNLKAGHCPHDEVPELVNEALINWAWPLGSPVPSQGIYSS